jgi:predicted nucleotide-binding protein
MQVASTNAEAKAEGSRMAPINAELLDKIQSKLKVTPGRAYALIKEKANATYLPRHLAAIALAGDLGINIKKSYATDQERLQISAARTGAPFPIASPRADGEPVRARRPIARRRPTTPPNRKSNSVMVVHGRNAAVRDAMYTFLRALGLRPIEWSHGVKATKKGAPVIREVLDAMFKRAAAVVVLLTPDDEAKLKKEFLKPSDAAYERTLTGQARANVLFEAGRAFGSHPDNTILVQVGSHRPLSDLSGVHIVRLDNEPASRNDLASRLETAGCAVDRSGDDWYTAGDFEGSPRRRR